MSEQERKTLVCPSCGNINAYTADECLKCGLALGPVRELLAGAAVPRAEEVTPKPAKPEEPAPLMPELPARPKTEELGQYVDSWRFLIRGMGDRAEDVAARFFKQLAGRGIEGLKLSVGKLIIDVGLWKRDSRDCYFVERDLGEEAVATIAVRIAQMGTDLFVEWRHYALPSLKPWWRRGLIAPREPSLKGFQIQDSTAFQLAVRAALEEAIDLAGISKALIQELPKGEHEERRVI